MAKLRDIMVALVVASAAEMLAVFALAPQYMLAENFSRSILRLFLLNFFLFSIWRLLIYPFFVSPLRDLPGPKGGALLWGHALSQFQKPQGSASLRYITEIPNGGLIRFRSFFNNERIIPTSSETLKAVMSDYAYDYEKPQAVRDFLTRVIGRGLILVEGNEHKFQRKHLLPAFQIKQIRDLYPVFWEKSRGLIEGIEAEVLEGGPETIVEFGEWATRVTLDIIGVAGMGRDFKALKTPDDELVQNYNELLEPTTEKGIFYLVNVLFPMWIVRRLPWKINASMTRISNTLRNYALDVVHERQRDIDAKRGLDERDILTLLVRSNDFKDTELAEQLLTFLAAGHETTSSALTWALYLMAVNPDMQMKLREEIREGLPSISELSCPSPSEIENLPYLHACCQEVLRLYPTVPVTIREAVSPTQLPVKTDDGTIMRAIPKGTPVLIIPWAINRSPHIWGKDAEEFVPERWMGEGNANTGGQSNNYDAGITFLHGPRSCIGQNFAKAEFKCLLAATVGRFEVEMADKHEKVIPAGVVTTKPSNGMKLKMRPIEGW